MHIPSVTPELAESVREKGAIDSREFGDLILHWFPGAWTLFFSLKRQACPKPKTVSREDDDTVPIRIMKALGQTSTKATPRRPIEPMILRVSVPERVGIKALTQVYEVLASDAMHRCAEDVNGVRFHLEDEETLLLVPEELKSPPSELPPISLIQERYARAYDQIRLVLADMEDSRSGVGMLDSSKAPKSREELIKLMAIRPYRLRIEREHGVELAWQWPGILAASLRDGSGKLIRFRSSAEQILAIDKQHS